MIVDDVMLKYIKKGTLTPESSLPLLPDLCSLDMFLLRGAGLRLRFFLPEDRVDFAFEELLDGLFIVKMNIVAGAMDEMGDIFDHESEVFLGLVIVFDRVVKLILEFIDETEVDYRK